jgi:hypothetical protein
MCQQGELVINNFFWIPCGTIKKFLNFPYANLKWFVLEWENTKIPLFHTGFLLMANFRHLMKNEGLQTVQRSFFEKKRKFATF